LPLVRVLLGPGPVAARHRREGDLRRRVRTRDDEPVDVGGRDYAPPHRRVAHPQLVSVISHSVTRSRNDCTSQGAATAPSSPRSSPLLEASPRFTPRSCSIRATSAPIPRLAPVITAVLPCKLMHPPVSKSATEHTQLRSLRADSGR